MSVASGSSRFHNGRGPIGQRFHVEAYALWTEGKVFREIGQAAGVSTRQVQNWAKQALWHRLLGGQRLSMGDYVRGPGATRGRAAPEGANVDYPPIPTGGIPPLLEQAGQTAPAPPPSFTGPLLTAHAGKHAAPS